MDRIKRTDETKKYQYHNPSYDEISKFGHSLHNIKRCTEKKEIYLKNNYPSVIISSTTDNNNHVK
ncbi:hypothetical protein NY_014-038 [NY_014 poxvirus]|uniref:hypothetical protein n=1 Tax=NY_014 poxvirus TaxID=2025360 RepID=UPI000B9A1088|nr:hypothetical protein CKM51_gp038 [NY_014 poxvirus]AST09439.1 hypothetical protein NY_014-038 [NY_014 poxvirus]